MNKTDNLNNQQLHSYARLLAAEAAIAAGVPETALMILANTVEVHARRSGSWQRCTSRRSSTCGCPTAFRSISSSAPRCR